VEVIPLNDFNKAGKTIWSARFFCDAKRCKIFSDFAAFFL